MIKQHQHVSIIFIFSLGLLILLYFILPKGSNPTLQNNKKPQTHVIDVKAREIDGRKVVGLKPGKEEEELKKIEIANDISPTWKESLTENLMAQGGSAISDITIQKVESLVWIQEGIALNVESAIVTVKDQDGAQTIFRVLVDSETGKILKNWDQPVIDKSNPREDPGIKIDPRYHQE